MSKHLSLNVKDDLFMLLEGITEKYRRLYPPPADVSRHRIACMALFRGLTAMEKELRPSRRGK